MSSNILKPIGEDAPLNCADGVLKASRHLNETKLIGQPANIVSPEYTESLVSLSKRARPADCARCIAECALKLSDDQVRGDRLQATHSSLIAHDPRGKLEEAHKILGAQSDYFEAVEAQVASHAVELARSESDRGLSEKKIEEASLPIVDSEAIEDFALAT